MLRRPRAALGMLGSLIVAAALCTSAARPADSPRLSPRQIAAARLAAAACPEVIGHRGAPLVAPENTQPAIAAALAGGADWIENDVRFTKSDVPMIIHDADVYRTTSSTVHRNVQDMWWSEITPLDFGYPKKFGTRFAGTKALTFYDWLVLVRDGGARGLVELKVVPDANELAKFVNRIDITGMWDKIILQSFYPAALSKVKAVRPQVVTMLLESPGTQDTIRSTNYLDTYGGYSVEYRSVSKARVTYWKSTPRSVFAWTPDAPTEWQWLKVAGVDGIITNDAPGLAAWEAANC